MVEIYIDKNNTRYKLDLFEDENIEISLTQKDFKNFSASIADYSKDFSVPASLNNQNIFGFYEEASSNDFDFRYKYDAFIFVDGVFFRAGNIKLNSAIKKYNYGSSYSLSFFSNEVKQIKLLDQYTLRDLEYSALNFDYNSTNIINLVKNFGYTYKTFIPLISKGQQWFYSTNSSDDQNADNISSLADSNVRGIKLSQLRPAISLAEIINLINNNINLPTFTSSLLTDSRLKNLYMWLSSGKKDYIDDANTSTGLKVNFDADYNSEADGFNLTRGTFTNIGTLKQQYQFFLDYDVDKSIIFRVKRYNDNSVVYSTILTAATTIESFNLYLDSGAEVYFEVVQLDGSFTLSANFNLQISLIATPSNITKADVVKSTSTSITLGVDFEKLIPNMKLSDFILGVAKLFNAVLIPNSETGEIAITTYNDWISQGSDVDITQYVDVKNVQISNLELYKNIKFDYQANDSLNNKAFKDIFNREFGSLEAILDFDTESSFETTLPFSVLMPEKLVDVNDANHNNVTHNIGRIYNLGDDNKSVEYNVKPLIFYASQATKTIQYDNGTPSTTALRAVNLDEVSFQDFSQAPLINTSEIFGDLTDLSNKQSILFSNDIDAFYNQPLENSLYKSFYQDYIDDIYSIYSRFIGIDCYLPISIYSTLKMNDTIIFQNKRYKIENFNINITNGKTRMKLRSYIR